MLVAIQILGLLRVCVCPFPAYIYLWAYSQQVLSLQPRLRKLNLIICSTLSFTLLHFFCLS